MDKLLAVAQTSQIERMRAIEVTFLGEWLVGGNDTHQLYC
jgi:hypothetical protein